MTDAKWEYILALDEEFLQGGIILSEWTTFLVRDAEQSFCANANISAILTCQAAIESHLRYEYFTSDQSKGWGFYQLIENSSMEDELKQELHQLRKFRNRWVHIFDPADDNILLERAEFHEAELEEFAKLSIKIMLKTLYKNQFL